MTTPATPAIPNQQPTPAPDSGGGWQQAASTAASAVPQQSPAPPQNQAQPSQQPPPQAPAPQVTALPAPPQTAKPVRPGGIRGFIDRMVDSLAGTDTSRVRQDPEGNIYLKHENLTRGQQWLRIGAEALSGAAAGLAQKGAGSKGQAAAAGFKAGQEERQGEQKQNDQDLARLANITALNHQIAANALELTRKQVEGAQHDIEFSEHEADRMAAQGATLAGHAGTLQEVTKFMRDTPNFNKDQVGSAMYYPVATYSPDGKANGFDIYKRVPGSDEEMLPKGTKIPIFDSVNNKIVYQESPGPIKQGDLNAYAAAAGNASQTYRAKEAEINERNANAEEKRNPKAKPLTPEDATLKRAEAARDWAMAHKEQADADAAAAKSKETQGPLVDEIGQGKMVPGRLGYLLAKNPDLMDAVAQKYPGFDSSKIDSYVAAYKDFTSGKTADQLTSGETALGHMNELRKLNTVASHIPGTPAWNAYHNKVDTLATELAKFYGDSTVSAIDAIKSTLGANLPGTRDGAIKTQSESMLDRFDSFRQRWKNAAPSDAYEAKLPWISPQAEAARAELDHAYHGTPAAAAPLTNLHYNPQTGQTIGYDGKQYVDAKTRQPVGQ